MKKVCEKHSHAFKDTVKEKVLIAYYEKREYNVYFCNDCCYTVIDGIKSREAPLSKIAAQEYLLNVGPKQPPF